MLFGDFQLQELKLSIILSHIPSACINTAALRFGFYAFFLTFLLTL
jgi:hypothetical protein